MVRINIGNNIMSVSSLKLQRGVAMIKQSCIIQRRCLASTTTNIDTSPPQRTTTVQQRNVPPFKYKNIFSPDPTRHNEMEFERLDEISDKYVKVIKPMPGYPDMLRVEPEALKLLSERANKDMAHLLRTSHMKQVASILTDPEATDNDKFVALQFMKNAIIAAEFTLPMCQDTGTATVLGKKGHLVLTDGNDEEALCHGIYNIYTTSFLRYSQLAPLTMYEEKNTGTNLPALVDIMTCGDGLKYELLFIQKGAGCANKTFLYQKTRALLRPEEMKKFLDTEIRRVGTAACPPYHFAIVIGGLSAEQTLKTVKLANTRYLDDLPTKGDVTLGTAFRDLEMEKQVLEMTRHMGIGAQWGGKYFCHDVRVVRLPRHSASNPVGLGLSCSADRQVVTKITPDGVFMEKLERNPGRLMPEVDEAKLVGTVVSVNLNKGMAHVLDVLKRYPVKTKLHLNGTLIVARDLAHARMAEQLKQTGKLPDYMYEFPIYYAGPAKKPPGMASGSFGPTTASRMDTYLDMFQSVGASMITVAKGNRSPLAARACGKYGGFYLCSVGGPAATLATESIKKVELLDMEDLGMEAVWRISVEKFPALITIDHKGNDLFAQWIPV